MKTSLTAMLKQFNIPKNSDFIVYDEETRKVLFFAEQRMDTSLKCRVIDVAIPFKFARTTSFLRNQ